MIQLEFMQRRPLDLSQLCEAKFKDRSLVCHGGKFSVKLAFTKSFKCNASHNLEILNRPNSASELAVGCHTGTLVWQVDPKSVVTRPSITCATVLKRPGHSPVTSIQWNSTVC